MHFYETLLASLGPSRWWPGETPFEVCVGAVLTQNTNWSNVQKAIDNLKSRDLLYPEKMASLEEQVLAELIRPSGYFRIKARRLKNLLELLRLECAYDLSVLGLRDMQQLRSKLLQVKGIGPETADSILLYALEKPSFVVDTYTRRILNRHFLVHEDIDYHELRDFFMDRLPLDVAIYNEYHALLVRTGKEWCRKNNPRCDECPLGSYL
ncbi:endonuclease III domain-containing protein [Desulfonatronospira sp.]|uniref:endonuclease III domain-containing protein n=1 Tax=Desulfonatronospira sp. TaxID=1962951 RepID=UPI0025C6B8E9|nr:endonuclease III domain-containing protein [Desulfonatronospira sp.]